MRRFWTRAGTCGPPRCPADPRFDFPTFDNRLDDLGFVIYPSKVSGADCFGIGTIGRIFPDDVRALLRAIEQTLSLRV